MDAVYNQLEGQLGGITDQLIELDVQPGARVDVLVALQTHLRGVCKRLGCTFPHWMEARGRSVMRSYLDNLRRDVRHVISSDFTHLGILDRPTNAASATRTDFKEPFVFLSTTRRPSKLLIIELHHELVDMYSMIERYIPKRRVLQHRLQRELADSPAFREWTIDYVEVGHPIKNERYANSRPNVFFDSIRTHIDPDGTEHQSNTTPHHRILTRNTYINPSGVRIYAIIMLNVNIFITHRVRTKERRMITYDYRAFSLTLELKSSPSYDLLQHEGQRMVIRPRNVCVHTLRPSQWAVRDVVARQKNVPRAAIWLLIDILATSSRNGQPYRETLERLDRMVPDVVDLEYMKGVVHEREGEVIRRITGRTSFSMEDLVRLPDTVRVKGVQRGSKRGKDVHLNTPYLKQGSWCISVDSELYSHTLLAEMSISSIATRLFINALIVSHVYDTIPYTFDISNVSGESMHDTFY